MSGISPHKSSPRLIGIAPAASAMLRISSESELTYTRSNIAKHFSTFHKNVGLPLKSFRFFPGNLLDVPFASNRATTDFFVSNESLEVFVREVEVESVGKTKF